MRALLRSRQSRGLPRVRDALGLYAAADATRHPQENGKQERSGGYVKDNALKGRRFDSLAAQNAFLQHWNRTIARPQIHGTTRRQVWTHFLDTEQRALQPLAATAFQIFTSGARTAHADGHIEVDGSFYPVPLVLLGQGVRVQWDARLVRVFHGDTLVAVHAKVAAGLFAPRTGEAEASTRQQAYVDRLLGQCDRVGPALRQWADAAIIARGVRAIRLIQGVLSLTRRHPRERVLYAVAQAFTMAWRTQIHFACGTAGSGPSRSRCCSVHARPWPGGTARTSCYRLADLPRNLASLQAAARTGRLAVHFSSRSAFGRPVRFATRAAGEEFKRRHYRRVGGQEVCSIPWPVVLADYDQRLKRLRRRLHMSQAAFAKAIGAGNKAVTYQWESRRRCPSPVFWEKVAAMERRLDTDRL